MPELDPKVSSVGTIVIFSSMVGYIMAWTGRTRPWLWAGGVVNLIANGLLIMLNGTLPRAVEYVFLAMSGAGVGFIAQTNTVSAQSKVARELLASVTTMTMWSKSLGGIVGIAMQGTIIQNVFLNNMRADPAAVPVSYLRLHGLLSVHEQRWLIMRYSTVPPAAEGSQWSALAAWTHPDGGIQVLRQSIWHDDDCHGTLCGRGTAVLAHC